MINRRSKGALRTPSPSIKQEEITIAILNEACTSLTKSRRQNATSLLLPLDSYSTVVASTLFLNNYEINFIACTYLSLWLKDTSSSYITVNMIIQYFEPTYHRLLQYMFPKNIIEWSDFFIFVCIFVFCEPCQLLQLILTLSKIYSHLYVSVDQINEFNNLISLCEPERKSLYNFISTYKYNMSDLHQDTYAYKAFTYFFQKSCSYEAFIYRLRRELISFSLNDHLYLVISNRIKAFYQLDYLVVIPSESFCVKLRRKIFTDEPSPFSFDYGIPNPTSKNINQMILKICHRYGFPDGRQTFTQYSMVSHSVISHSLSFTKMSSLTQRNKSNTGRTFEQSPCNSGSGYSPYKKSPNKHRIYPTVEETEFDYQQGNSKIV